jgi:radical SAM protein with 4Fe4S-binding SPASM domain
MAKERQGPVDPTQPGLPKWIAWEITGRCNLHCIHCRSWSDSPGPAGEFTGEEARGLIDQIADYASPVLVLSGGEPLLREDCFDLARYGTARGLRMCLATNGTLVDEGVCDAIRSSGIRMVSLSLDGSTPEIHDDFRQQPGAYDGVIRAASFFRRHEIPFLINSSFTKRNQDDIENVYRAAKELGAKAWYMFMIVPTGRAEGALEELITGEDYEKILRWHYRQEQDEAEMLMRPTCAPHYFRIVQQESKREGKKWKQRSLAFATGVSKGCLAGQHIAFIDRLGHVRPCSYFAEDAGSLREQSFQEIWENSALLADLRDFRKYKGKCGGCEYLRVCGGCRARAAALEGGDYLAEEPFCSYVPIRTARKDGVAEDQDRPTSD